MNPGPNGVRPACDVNPDAGPFLFVASAGNPLAEARLRPGVTEAHLRALETEFGLDKPVLERCWAWLTGFVQGDWERSVALNRARGGVQTAVLEAVSITARLVTAAAQYSIFDHVATGLAYVMFSIPVFCFAVIIKTYGIRLNDLLEFLGLGRWITTAGSPETGFTGNLMDVVHKHSGTLVLPTFSLMVISFAGYSGHRCWRFWREQALAPGSAALGSGPSQHRLHDRPGRQGE